MSSGQRLYTHESTVAVTACTRLTQDQTSQWSSMDKKRNREIQPLIEWQSVSSLFLFSEMYPMVRLSILHWPYNHDYTDSTNWINWVIKKGKIYKTGKRTMEGHRQSGRGSRNWIQKMICIHIWNYQTIIFLRNWEYLIK